MPKGQTTYIPTVHATPLGREVLVRSSRLLMPKRKWIMLVVAGKDEYPPNIVAMFREVRVHCKAQIPEAHLARDLAELERAGLVRIAR